MKRSTRILSIIMAFAMIVSSMVVVASAAEAEVGTISVVAGDVANGQVAVDIVVANNPGVTTMRLQLGYPAEGFTIASVEDGGILGEQYVEDDGVNLNLNPFILFWSNGTATTDFTEDGTIATVVFNVADDVAPGSYNISVSYEKGNDQIINAADKEVEFVCNSATVVVEETVTPVESIALSETKIELVEEATATLTATVLPEDADYDAIEWTSSNDAVATVENGVVTAVAAGTATITAAIGEIKAECAVTVNAKTIAVTGITLNKTEATLTEGETLELVATVSPADATNKTVVWESDDEDVATVVDGVVTAVKAGEATITATAGDKTATCAVTVEAKATPVAKIVDDEYTSVAEALAAAKSGDKVVMVADSTESVIMINPGVTLDIGEYTLTADYVVGYKGSVLTGAAYNTTTQDFAKLVVPEDNVILYGDNGKSGEYSVLPFWNGTDAYQFTLYDVYEIEAAYYNDEEIYLQFTQAVTTNWRNTYFKTDGVSDNNLEVVVTLTWSNDNGKYNQTYVYNDYFTSVVAAAGLKMSYTFTLKGYDMMGLDPAAFTMSAGIRSTTGVATAKVATVNAQ